MSYDEHLISMAGGDGDLDLAAIREELARAAKNALSAYAEGYGTYKAFKRAKEMLAAHDARKEAGA